MMNEKIAMTVESSIGKVLEMENEGDSSLWGRCLKVRVNVNIHNVSIFLSHFKPWRTSGQSAASFAKK